MGRRIQALGHRLGGRGLVVSWLIIDVEVWFYFLTPGAPGLLSYRDPQTRTAVLSLYPPTIIFILLVGALFAIMVAWPAVWLGLGLGNSERGSLWRALIATLVFVVALSGVWSGIMELVLDRFQHPRRILGYWAVLAGLSLLPAWTHLLLHQRARRKAVSPGVA